MASFEPQDQPAEGTPLCFHTTHWSVVLAARADAADRAACLKRGSGNPTLSLDAMTAERRYALEPADPCTPEQLFERRWALTGYD